MNTQSVVSVSVFAAGICETLFESCAGSGWNYELALE